MNSQITQSIRFDKYRSHRTDPHSQDSSIVV